MIVSEQDRLVLDVWLQFSEKDGDARSARGIRVLEEVQNYLSVAGLINSKGLPGEIRILHWRVLGKGWGKTVYADVNIYQMWRVELGQNYPSIQLLINVDRKDDRASVIDVLIGRWAESHFGEIPNTIARDM